MLKLVDDLLKADESQVEIQVFISLENLKFVVNYCSAYNYIKIKSTIFFPALYQELSQNCCPTESTIMQPIADSFEQLV